MKALICLVIGFRLATALVLVQAAEPSVAFIDGVKAYEKGDYSEAVRSFKTTADGGVVSGRLYYNLGNAYFKSGDLGRAVLWYEKALRLTPRDPDLRFNHEYALSLVKDERAEYEGPLVKVAFFWRAWLPPRTIQYAVIAANALLWLSLGFLIIRPVRWLKTAAAAAAVLLVLTGPTAFYRLYEEHARRTGVVLAEDMTVRSGFGDESAPLFVLHAGTRVMIEAQRDRFYRIRYGEDKIGWVEEDQVGAI